MVVQHPGHRAALLARRVDHEFRERTVHALVVDSSKTRRRLAREALAMGVPTLLKIWLQARRSDLMINFLSQKCLTVNAHKSSIALPPY